MTAAERKLLIDPYLEWTAREGIPIHEDFGFDLLTAETAPWPRLGDRCKAAFVHLKGRGDWMTVFLLEIPPGGQSAPQQHLFDELFYVVSGSGSVVVEMPNGGRHAFEWGPRSLFAPPLNCRYRIFNASGSEPVRLASSNNMRILMNVLHDADFLFDHPFGFPEREGLPGYYSGEGEMTAIRPGRNLWETNFVPDLGAFELKPWEARGVGSSNIQFLMSEGSMGRMSPRCRSAPTRRATATAPACISSLFMAPATRSSGTRATAIFSASTGATACASLPPTACSISISIPAPGRPAMWRSASAASAIRSSGNAGSARKAAAPM
jgi:mannose-6-phosphate isomerase-like protein (cupin superfamily)